MTTNPVEMSKQERMSFLEGVLDELRPRHAAGTLVTGGREALMLWEATVDAFVDGNWVAALLCAQATCERILGGLVSLHRMPGLAGSEPKDWERQWGLGKLIGHVREQGWVEPQLLDQVAEVSELRKPFGHWRRPVDAGTIGRRIGDRLRLDADIDPESLELELLAEDAALAVTTALRLYFGNYFGGPYAPARPPG
jgi:hypothetical protein